MNTIKVNTNREGFNLSSLVGKKAVWRGSEDIAYVGTIEAKKGRRAYTPLFVRFDNGTWGGLGSVIELIEEVA